MSAAESSTHADWLRPHARGCTLAVRVQPGAKKSAVLGILGEGEDASLKIAVQAPPIEGRANEALIAFVATRLDLPRNAVELLRGQSSRSKTLLICGLTPKAAR